MYPRQSCSVLFICPDNAIRSQLAAAWLYRLTAGQIEARTAGIEPIGIPLLVQQRVAQLRRKPVSLAPTSLRRVSGSTFDYIITLCDKQCEQLPAHPYDDEGVVWDFPAPETPEQLRQMEFELMDRLLLWLEVTGLRAA